MLMLETDFSEYSERQQRRIRENDVKYIVNISKIAEVYADYPSIKRERLNELHEYLGCIYDYLTIKNNGMPVSSTALWNYIAYMPHGLFATSRNGRLFFIITSTSKDTIYWKNSRSRKRAMKRKTFNNLCSSFKISR